MTLARWLRPTILDRYVAREIWPPTALGLLLFTFILLLDQITNLMKILVSRGADLVTVARAFAYLLPSIFSVTIPMAFLMGVLLAFGRLASDSEIVALRASGISPARLLRPVVALSAITGMLTFYIVAVALPAANQAYREIIFALIVSKARTGVTPRVFNDDLIPGGNMVLYVSDIPAETGEWRDIFIYDTKSLQQPRAILARAGRLVIEREKAKVELDLRDGVIYTFNSASPEQIDEDRFAAGQFPLSYEDFFPKIPLARGDREMDLPALVAEIKKLRAEGKGRKETGRFEVEYHKKFAIPFACVVFGFLGLGLSLGSKKEARSAAFGLSIAVIFIYYVIIRLGEQAGDTGLMSPILAMWGANLILGTAALLLLWLNHREAAFDPLDPSHYKVLLPRIRFRKRTIVEAPAAPTGPRRRVVVVRIPRIGFPVPGILDRYVARNYLKNFGMVVTSFWALYVLVSFMDLFDDVQHNKVKGAVVFHYYTFSSTEIVHLLTPVAVLVSVLITFGLMARQNEITAMKAAGISVYRAVVPAIVISALTSFAMFEAAEYLLPPLNKIADRDYNVIKGRPPMASTVNQHRWLLGSDGRFYNYDYFQMESKEAPATLYGLSVYDVDAKEWRLRDRLYSARAAWDGLAYDVERGWRRSFGPGGTFTAFHQAHRTREIEPPSYFSREERAADTMSFAELKSHIASLENLGLDVTKLRVGLYRKLSFPTVALVMALLGIPFAFVVARHGALYGIAISLIIAIVYWAVLAMFETLGNNAYLPAALASWAPNLLFAATGLYFLFTLET